MSDPAFHPTFAALNQSQQMMRFGRTLLAIELRLDERSRPIELTSPKGSQGLCDPRILHAAALGAWRAPGQSTQLEVVSPPSGCSTCAVM
jgi:hypothetical protein